MKKCIACGEPLEYEDDVICQNCGARQTDGGDGTSAESTPTPAPEQAKVPTDDPATLVSGTSVSEEKPVENINSAEQYREIAREILDKSLSESISADALKAQREKLGIEAEAARQIEAEIRQEIERAGKPMGEYVELQIDANKSLYLGELGNINFRLKNHTPREISSVKLSISCQSVKDPVSRPLPGGRLSPSQERDIRTNIKPGSKGEDLLEIQLEYTPEGGRRQYMMGEAELMIFDRDDIASQLHTTGPQQVSINISDVQKMMAVEMKDLLSTDSRERSVADVIKNLQARGEPIWVQISLYPDEEKIRRATRVEPARPSAPKLQLAGSAEDIPAANAMLLRVASPADLPSSRMHVFSKSEVAMGRLSKNDIRLLKLPIRQKGDENYKASELISRLHLTGTYDGDAFAVVDSGSSMGTVVSEYSQNRIPDGEPVEVPDGGEIVVAGVLDLRLDTARRGEQDDILLELREFKVNWRTPFSKSLAPAFGLNGNGSHQWLRLRRTNNPTGDEYLILVSTALIGSGSDCAWVLDHPSVKKRHARVILYQGRYWIHAWDKEQIAVDGQTLSGMQIAVLHAGSTVSIGDVKIEIAPPASETAR